MKIQKRCPKCSSEDIVRIDGKATGQGTGNYLLPGKTMLSGTVNVHRYICLECGHTEEWIDKEDLIRIKQGSAAKKI